MPHQILKDGTHFLRGLGADAASLRGLPRGRLSWPAGLPLGVVTAPPTDVEGSLSEESTIFSSDDILPEEKKQLEGLNVYYYMIITQSYLGNISHSPKTSSQVK